MCARSIVLYSRYTLMRLSCYDISVLKIKLIVSSKECPPYN